MRRVYRGRKFCGLRFGGSQILTRDGYTRILRPGFFMENLEGMKGAIAVSILKKGLKFDSTISFVVSCLWLLHTCVRGADVIYSRLPRMSGNWRLLFSRSVQS